MVGSFESVDTILAVVDPMLFHIHCMEVILMPFLLPEGVLLIVEGGEEVERLRQAGERNMVGEHGVEMGPCNEAPIPRHVLGVIIPVLPYDLDFGVREQFAELPDDLRFFIDCPVGAAFSLVREEGDAEGVPFRPREAETFNVAEAGFDVAGEAERVLFGLLAELGKDSDGVWVAGADGEIIFWKQAGGWVPA